MNETKIYKLKIKRDEFTKNGWRFKTDRAPQIIMV